MIFYGDTVDRHGKHEPLEGEDFFFDYGTRRSGKTIALRLKRNGTVATPIAEAGSPT